MHSSSINPMRRPNRVNQVREGSALRPMNDRDSPLALWKIEQKTNAQLEAMNAVIRQLQSQIDRLRLRNGFSVDVNSFHPFKLYNVPTSACPPVDVVNDYDPANDAWRTFRIRAGAVGFRSTNANYKPNGGNSNYADLSAPETYISAVHPIGLSTLYGTDGARRTVAAGNEFFPYDEDTYDIKDVNSVVYLDNAGDFSVDGYAVTFVIKGTPDDARAVMAAFWIEVVDSSGFIAPIARVKARMITAQAGDSTGRINQFFPDAGTNTIIPIGIVVPKVGYFPATIDLGKDLYCDQILTGNPVNRYSQGYQGSVGGSNGQAIYRGNWDSDSLANQYFYPGDMVMAGNRMYIHNGYGAEAAAPTGDGTPNWTWLDINGA